MRSHSLRKGLRFVACFAFLACLFLPLVSFAQANPNDTFGITEVNNSIGLVSTDIRVIVGRVIQIVLSLLGVIAVGLIIYAGFMIMTAAGSEDKVGEGKKILVNAVVGLLVILSAVAIVQFVLNALSQATGSGSGGDDTVLTSEQDAKQTFAGTASRGTIIKDHYPERDEKNVARNTKISVTFRDAFVPSSTIQNTNNTCWPSTTSTIPVPCADGLQPYYGDCQFDQVPFSWETHCDQLVTSSLHIYKKSDTQKIAVRAAFLATYDTDKKMHSFTLRPLTLLGSEKKDETSVVAFTNNLKKDEVKGDGTYPDMFASQLAPYKWEFETSVNADFIPPTVTSINPSPSSTAFRNSIVQVQFSEAVDPTMAAGLVNPTSPFFSALFPAGLNVSGEWRLSSGYKILEFISSQSCGQNSCGETMYCLPTPNTAINASVPYVVLLRTGDLLLASSTLFEGKPGSGIMDMAGNILDGNANNIPNGRPSFGNAPKTITTPETLSTYDNFYWNFSVKNSIDLSVPYIHKVMPGLDSEGVSGQTPVTIQMSKLILSDSMYNGAIAILEEPATSSPQIDFWSSPTMSVLTGEKAEITLKHREFGPGGIDMHYFVSVSSSLKSLNQNCFYPGVGPASNIKGASPVCESYSGTNCVAVNSIANIDTGCVVTDGTIAPSAQADIGACILKMKTVSHPAN